MNRIEEIDKEIVAHEDLIQKTRHRINELKEEYTKEFQQLFEEKTGLKEGDVFERTFYRRSFRGETDICTERKGYLGFSVDSLKHTVMLVSELKKDGTPSRKVSHAFITVNDIEQYKKV